MNFKLLIIGLLLGAIGGGCQGVPAQAPTTDASRNTAWTRAFAAPGPPSTSGMPIGQENRINMDARFASLLKESFPQKQWFWYDHWKLTPLPELMQVFMGVPGDAILDEDRYVSIDGCVPHDCDNRGMLWVDTRTDPAVIIFAGIDSITSNTTPSKSHLWIYTSEKLSWQKIPSPFLSSLHRWLVTIGTDPYAGTHGYRYNFSLATIVQPNGVMLDMGPEIFGLGATGSHASPGAGL